jgi:hypothetical protein|tara:strand:- start:2794 stop:3012 length:219 start_codon:yes stop_codon:yes gene_type:complete
MTKEEKIEELAEWIVESMDMSALESYAREQLEEYYSSDEGLDDFETNYTEMKKIQLSEEERERARLEDNGII